jgi:hypothetical protein
MVADLLRAAAHRRNLRWALEATPLMALRTL